MTSLPLMLRSLLLDMLRNRGSWSSTGTTHRMTALLGCSWVIIGIHVVLLSTIDETPLEWVNFSVLRTLLIAGERRCEVGGYKRLSPSIRSDKGCFGSGRTE